jgi:predicted phage terminase large subunit-like protein
MPGFSLTAKQDQANDLLASSAKHIMLAGGSRSGKTFLAVRAIVMRALKAPGSRHAILRFRFNAVKSSIAFDTFPKVMAVCYPGIEWTMNKTDWFASIKGSEIWFGGLDDKDRTEKILGNEYVTIMLNECSQIPWDGRNMAVTRLAQKVGATRLAGRYKRRFLHGEFAEAAPNALFPDEHMDRWRTDGELPDMQRVVVAVDPSGSGDEDNADNDAIGIVVAGLGTDGIAYLLEDLTVKAGPATWGRIATNAYDRHKADLIVAEINYGGAMVKQVIKAARPNTPYREVTASRGKVVRAEPVAALCETGKIRLAGRFPDLEDELSGFTTGGYVGANSPNRADALVWAMSELFPGMVKQETKPKERYKPPMMTGGWMR